MKAKYVFKKYRVNEKGFSDDKNPESILLYSNYTLKRLREIAKYILIIEPKIYAIEIKTIKTNVSHFVV